MTILATAHWRRLDREGTDRCTLARAERGWILDGHARWGGEAPGNLVYVVRCSRTWETLSADVAGTFAGREIALRLQRDGARWSVNGENQPGLDECVDLDLSFSPATNLLPLRRLKIGAAPVPVRAAWLVPDLDRLEALDQSYASLGDGGVAYASPGFDARLAVHPSGFVTGYPDLWDGWVDG